MKYNFYINVLVAMTMLFILDTDICAAAVSPQNETIAEKHIYKNIAIQAIDIRVTDQLHQDKISIHKSQFNPNPVRADLFDVPKIGEMLWEITADDLEISEETCLGIDALLCRDYKEAITDGTKCYSECISNGPEFVAFDEEAGLLYIDAGTNVFGTGGTPRFLFVADINTRKIEYLNTFVGPYEGVLSPNGKYLALVGTNDIEVCDTKTGNYIQLGVKNVTSGKHERYHFLGNIKWLENTVLKYEDICYEDKFQNKFISKAKKIVNIKNKKVITSRSFV